MDAAGCITCPANAVGKKLSIISQLSLTANEKNKIHITNYGSTQKGISITSCMDYCNIATQGHTITAN